MSIFSKIESELRNTFCSTPPEEEKLDTAKREHGTIERKTCHGIEIVGPPVFITKTEQALDLLFKNTKSFKFYGCSPYLEKILHDESPTGMRAQLENTTFVVDEATFESPLLWYASTIAHDAYHSYLYQQGQEQGKTGDALTSTWKGTDAEKQCLTFQIQTLNELIYYIEDTRSDAEALGYVKYLVELKKDPKYQDIEERNW